MLIDFELLFKSFAIGVVIATPIGAASILCMRRLLIKGPFAGFVSALGIATADMIYVAIATFGLSTFSGIILQHQPIIRLGGGTILIAWGLKLLFMKNRTDVCSIAETNYLKDFGSTFFITLSNPMIIMFLATILTTIGIQETPDTAIDAITLIAWVFAGSLSWWIGIIGFMIILKYKPMPSILDTTNKVSGALLVGFGALFLVKGILKFSPF